MFQKLEDTISMLGNYTGIISEKRKALLSKMAEYIKQTIEQGKTPQLNFICTHNSRRSHISQIWAAAMTQYSGFEIETFSGGTEATAFNPNAIAAMERAGFEIEIPEGDNPHVKVSFAQDGFTTCYSKVFDAPENPNENFAAVMTCGHADENCPFIPGAEARFALTFDDPKEGDGTPEQDRIYDERVFEIGTQIFYLFKQIKNG